MDSSDIEIAEDSRPDPNAGVQEFRDFIASKIHPQNESGPDLDIISSTAANLRIQLYDLYRSAYDAQISNNATLEEQKEALQEEIHINTIYHAFCVQDELDIGDGADARYSIPKIEANLATDAAGKLISIEASLASAVARNQLHENGTFQRFIEVVLKDVPSPVWAKDAGDNVAAFQSYARELAANLTFEAMERERTRVKSSGGVGTGLRGGAADILSSLLSGDGARGGGTATGGTPTKGGAGTRGGPRGRGGRGRGRGAARGAASGTATATAAGDGGGTNPPKPPVSTAAAGALGPGSGNGANPSKPPGGTTTGGITGAGGGNGPNLPRGGVPPRPPPSGPGGQRANPPGPPPEPPTITAAPRPRPVPGSVPPTRFASTYRSTHSLQNPHLIPLLPHVNCSYLSTPGLSPTLTELKQHVQSLIVLIRSLTVSSGSGVVDNRNVSAASGTGTGRGVRFHDGESYDFLNDLSVHYQGPEKVELVAHHQLPLNSVLNTLEQAVLVPAQTVNGCCCDESGTKKSGKKNSACGGLPAGGLPAPHSRAQYTSAPGIPAHHILRDICPLHSAYPAPINGTSLPYATRQILISHANDILELLDHEYSAKGGLLSILPPKEDVEDRKKAESTYFGQLIKYVTDLVQRLHDLERMYANAMDALSGEALVPHQALSRLGPDGRAGRELVYPQDRFVLVNAGEDLVSFLQNEFDKKDISEQAIMENYRRVGTTGEKLWQERGGKEYSRGITAVDVVTRYYRIRGNEPEGRNLKTIFILPAHQIHPGVQVTRKIESEPTVVAVVKPVWPERQSILDMKYRSDLNELKLLRREQQQWVQDQEIATNSKNIMEYDLESKRGQIRDLEAALAARDIILNNPENAARAKLLQTNVTAPNQAREEAIRLKAQNDQDREVTRTARREAERIRDQLSAELTAFQKQRREQIDQDNKDRADAARKLAQTDAANAQVAAELDQKLKTIWLEQMKQAQIIVDFLSSNNIPVGDIPIPAEVTAVQRTDWDWIFRTTFGQQWNQAQPSGIRGGAGHSGGSGGKKCFFRVRTSDRR